MPSEIEIDTTRHIVMFEHVVARAELQAFAPIDIADLRLLFVIGELCAEIDESVVGGGRRVEPTHRPGPLVEPRLGDVSVGGTRRITDPRDVIRRPGVEARGKAD